MNEDGIDNYDFIPEDERLAMKKVATVDGIKEPILTRKWSDPFKVGDVVPVFGKEMKIVKVKQLRGEIVLRCINR